MRDIDLPKLMRDVDAKRQKEGKTWLDVTNELDFASPSTIHNMRHGIGQRIYLDRIIAVLTWLGTTDLGPYLPSVQKLGIGGYIRTEWMAWWGSDRRSAAVFMEFEGYLDGAEKALAAMPGGHLSYRKIVTHDWIDVK